MKAGGVFFTLTMHIASQAIQAVGQAVIHALL